MKVEGIQNIFFLLIVRGFLHPIQVGAGAKILGPIEIGAGARVGSNSVILKPVPEGATVVGIPGHVIDMKARADKPQYGWLDSNPELAKEPEAQRKQTERDKIASKMGFDPYGATADMPDPVAYAINHMLDHIQTLDEQVEDLGEDLRGDPPAVVAHPDAHRPVGQAGSQFDATA